MGWNRPNGAMELEKRSRMGAFFWFCVFYGLVLIGCALGCSTYSLDIVVLLLSFIWLILVLVSLLAWVLDKSDWRKYSAAPLVALVFALPLAWLASGASEPLAWALKRNTMERAAYRLARQHPQQGAAPLNEDERWILSPDEDHRVDVRRYGDDWTVLFITGNTMFNGPTGYLFSWRDRAPAEPLHERRFLEARGRKAPHWFHVYSPDGWD